MQEVVGIVVWHMKKGTQKHSKPNTFLGGSLLLCVCLFHLTFFALTEYLSVSARGRETCVRPCGNADKK